MRLTYRPLAALALVAGSVAAASWPGDIVGGDERARTDKEREAEKARSRARSLRAKARRPLTVYDERRIAAAVAKRARKAAKRQRDFAASAAGYYFVRAA